MIEEYLQRLDEMLSTNASAAAAAGTSLGYAGAG